MASIDDRRYAVRGGEKVKTGYAGAKPWRARWKDPATGKEKSQHFPRRIDAERFLDRIRGEISSGSYVDPGAGRKTFAEWCAEYADRAPRRRTTAARDEAALKVWWIPNLGKLPLASITPEHIRRVLRAMRDKGLAPSSIRTYYGVIRAVMAAAVAADVISRSPCRGIRLEGTRTREPRFLSMAELHKLAAELPEHYQPMVYVAGVLGLRWSEVAGLRVKRIDFARRTVTVAETIAEVEGVVMVADVKTKSSRRSLTAPPELMEMLAAHLERRGDPGPDEFVFLAPKGGMLRANAFRKRVFIPAVKAAGIEGLTFHGLRHSAVGFMIELGVHPRVIQKRMGHASIQTTFDIYGSVLPQLDEEVSRGLGGLLAQDGRDDDPTERTRSIDP